MVNPALIKADPAEQNYNSAPYAVPENIATVDSIKNNILDQNKSLNAVNNLTKGGSRGRKHARKSSSSSRGNRSHRRRNYKSRTYKRKSQKGGSTGQIPIFQSPGHATCTEGSQCPGAHNAMFTSISNQLESNGKNDSLLGGKKRFKKYNKKHSSKKKH